MREPATAMPAPAPPLHRCACGGTCASCRAAARARAGDAAPPIVHEVLRSGGDKLDETGMLEHGGADADEAVAVLSRPDEETPA